MPRFQDALSPRFFHIVTRLRSVRKEIRDSAQEESPSIISPAYCPGESFNKCDHLRAYGILVLQSVSTLPADDI